MFLSYHIPHTPQSGVSVPPVVTTPTLASVQNHPAYRIAIIYVHAREEQVLERARRRAEDTGRHVPVEEIKDSLYRVPRTVARLMPKADFVAHIEVRFDHQQVNK